jgi:hypothetical protein
MKNVDTILKEKYEVVIMYFVENKSYNAVNIVSQINKICFWHGAVSVFCFWNSSTV